MPGRASVVEYAVAIQPRRKRALVTGSSRGIGFAIAAALAGAGAEILINGRDQVALGEAAAKLAEAGAT